VTHDEIFFHVYFHSRIPAFPLFLLHNSKQTVKNFSTSSAAYASTTKMEQPGTYHQKMNAFLPLAETPTSYSCFSVAKPRHTFLPVPF